MKPILVLFIASLILHLCGINKATSQVLEVNGTVYGNWAADTVKVTSDILIPADSTLSINEGTYIEFQGPFRFMVDGNIQAMGTELSPIVFTIIDTMEMSNPKTPRGGWKGLLFNKNKADSSIFSYCQIRYGKAWSDTLDACGGVINIQESDKIRFSYCTISYSIAEFMGGAVYLNQSDVTFENCNISYNRAGIDSTGYGGGILVMMGSPVFKHCTISNNKAIGIGGGLCIWFTDNCTITHTIIDNNVGSTGGGAFFYNCNAGLFTNNLIINNTGYYFGGALGLKNTQFPIANCTMADNFGGQGGAIYGSSGVTTPFYNCIFSGNSAFGDGQQIYIAYLESTPGFYHSLITGGREGFGGSGGVYPGAFHGEYIQNQEGEESFVAAGDFNYCLDATSSCIDFGYTDSIAANIPPLDLAGNIRISGEAIDLGAFEFQHTSLINEKNISADIHISPNPVGEKALITFPEGHHIRRIKIINSTQNTVFQTSINKDQKHIIWDGSNQSGERLPSGCYFLVSDTGIAHKIILL